MCPQPLGCEPQSINRMHLNDFGLMASAAPRLIVSSASIQFRLCGRSDHRTTALMGNQLVAQIPRMTRVRKTRAHLNRMALNHARSLMGDGRGSGGSDQGIGLS